MASTDLTVQNGELSAPDSDDSIARIEAMGDTLPDLIQAGNTATIRELRERGEAASLAVKKLKYHRESLAFARLAVSCTAAIEMTEEKGSLGAAMDRGRLAAVLDECGQTVNDRMARIVASRGGHRHVGQERFRSLLRSHLAGRSVRPVALAAGLRANQLQRFVATESPYKVVSWWTAKPVCQALGIEERLRKLPPAPRRRGHSRHGKTSSVRWLHHRFRPGGGKWDEAGVRFTAMRDEMTRADPAWSHKDPLYEAMKTVSDIIQREIRAAEK